MTDGFQGLELIKYVLFMNDNGYTMHFVVLLRDASEEKKLCEHIDNHMGTVSTEVADIGKFTIVLVDDNPRFHPNETIPLFKKSYIMDCIEEGVILDIANYLKFNGNFKNDFNFMDVVYKFRYSWNDVPHKFRVKSEPNDAEPGNETDTSNNPDRRSIILYSRTSESEYETDISWDGRSSAIKRSPVSGGINKRTKEPYTKQEREAILKYCLQNYSATSINTLKGRQLWKHMENANICPRRSWQSMKEHFLKVMVKQLDTFTWLSYVEKQGIRSALK